LTFITFGVKMKIRYDSVFVNKGNAEMERTMETSCVIGIDAGGTKVAYGLFGSNGEIIERMEHPTDKDADGPTFSDILIKNIEIILDKRNLTFKELSGVGIGVPSFLLYEEGRVLMTSTITGINDFPMRKYLEDRIPTTIVLDNDANAAALAEHRYGAGRGTKHMVYVVLGTGLGGGIIINEKLFHGSYGWAGEIGHMIATADKGVMCGCENKGCYMSYVSGRFLPDHVRLGLEDGVESILNPDAMNGEKLIEAYKINDALAVKIVEQMAHNIAVNIFNVYQVLNINTFVFGGGLTSFGNILFDKVEAEFDRYNHISLPVHFKMAELKKDFGIIGAAEFIREGNN